MSEIGRALSAIEHGTPSAAAAELLRRTSTLSGKRPVRPRVPIAVPATIGVIGADSEKTSPLGAILVSAAH